MKEMRTQCTETSGIVRTEQKYKKRCPIPMEIVFHLQGPADTPLRKAQLFTSMDTQRFKSIIDGVDQKSKQ